MADQPDVGPWLHVDVSFEQRYDLRVSGQVRGYQQPSDRTDWTEQVLLQTSARETSTYYDYGDGRFVQRLSLQSTNIRTTVAPLPAEPSYIYNRESFQVQDAYPWLPDDNMFIIPIDAAERNAQEQAGFTWQFRDRPPYRNADGTGNADAIPRPTRLSDNRITADVQLRAVSRSSYMSFGSPNYTYPMNPETFEVNARIFAQYNPPVDPSRSDTSGAYVSAPLTLRSNGSSPELDGTRNDPMVSARMQLDIPLGFAPPDRFGIVTDAIETGPPPIPSRPILIQPFDYQQPYDSDFGREIAVENAGYQGNRMLFRLTAVAQWPDYRWVRINPTPPAPTTSPPVRVRQRDDGLGPSALRVRGASSRQRSVRVRGYL